MEPQDVDRLRACRSDICNDVMFDQIAPSLVQEGLLNREEVQRVQAKDSDAERAAVLLDLLPSKGPDALSRFMQVLQKNYPWLVERLKQAAPSTTSDCNTALNDCNTMPNNCIINNKLKQEQQLNQKVSTDMLNLVSKNYRVTQKWTSLAHTLQMDSQITPIRQRILVYQEDYNLCVTYLLKEWMAQSPKTANLGNLINALRDNTFNDVADDLEEKFVL